MIPKHRFLFRFYWAATQALPLLLTAAVPCVAQSYLAGIGATSSSGGRSSAGVYTNDTVLGQITGGPLQSTHYVLGSGSLSQFPPADDAPCDPTRLFIQRLGSAEVRLSWQSCPDRSYRIESTLDFRTWQSTPVLPAPPGGGPMNYTVPAARPSQFFRIRTQ